MTAARKDYIIELGAKWERELIWQSSDGACPPTYTPINLTGYTGKMQIRPASGSATLILELSTANGRITITPATGSIALVVDTADILALDLSSLTRRKTITETDDITGYQASANGLIAVYDIELTDGAGEVYRLVSGDVCFSEQVTV